MKRHLLSTFLFIVSLSFFVMAEANAQSNQSISVDELLEKVKQGHRADQAINQ